VIKLKLASHSHQLKIAIPISQKILIDDISLCNVIDTSPSILVNNSTNDILVRMSGISNEFLKFHWSPGVQEVVQRQTYTFLEHHLYIPPL